MWTWPSQVLRFWEREWHSWRKFEPLQSSWLYTYHYLRSGWPAEVPWLVLLPHKHLDSSYIIDIMYLQCSSLEKYSCQYLFCWIWQQLHSQQIGEKRYKFNNLIHMLAHKHVYIPGASVPGRKAPFNLGFMKLLTSQRYFSYFLHPCWNWGNLLNLPL